MPSAFAAAALSSVAGRTCAPSWMGMATESQGEGIVVR